jgi:CRP-like cAMP-binding protein
MQLGPYSFTAEAVTDVVATCYPQRQIDALAELDPSIRVKFQALILNQLMGAQQHMMLLGCLNAEERLSSFLHWLSERSGARETLFDVPMSRLDIADYLGLTVETVCRTLSKLKRAGFVKLKPSHQMVWNTHPKPIRNPAMLVA